MADAGIQVKAEAFNRALREMTVRLRNHATEQEVITAEVGKVLEATLAKTKAASLSKIRTAHQQKEWTTVNGKRYRLTNRYPNAVWSQVGDYRKAALARKLAARGMAKQSWLALAKKLGVTIAAPGYVQNATVPNVDNAQNVSTERNDGEKSFGIRIENGSPLLTFADARQAFFAALAGRERFYFNNLKRGVFNDLKTIAAKYPGIVVNG